MNRQAAPPPVTCHPSPEDSPTVRPRAYWVGGALAVGINLASPYFEWVVHSQLLTTNYFPIGLMFPFFLVAGVGNVAARAMWPRAALSAAELGVVFLMAAVAITIPTYGATGYLIAILAAPYYFASPENRWAEYFHGYLPSWAVPGPGVGTQWFFEGVPRGETIPWCAWGVALVWWMSFLAAALFGCVCLLSVLRRQWMEHERLNYPLAAAAVAIMGGEGRGRVYRERLYWLGFAAGFGVMAWNIAGYFCPALPEFPRNFRPLQLMRGFPPIFTTFYLPMVAVGFFLRLDVSFSIWFFVLMGIVQEGIYNRLGFSIVSSLSVYHYDASRPDMAWQAWGALVAMVGVNLWTARQHLANVVASAFGVGNRTDETDELLSPRAAVFGGLGAYAYMTLWFWRAGLSLGASALFNAAVFVALLGIARLVVEGGLAFVRSPLTAQSFTVNVLGNSAMAPSALGSMGLTFGWFGDPICAFLPSVANALRVGYGSGASGRAMRRAIGLGAFLSVATAVPFTLWMSYRHGAYNFGTWLFGRGAQVPYEYVVHALHAPPHVEWNKIGCMGLGAAVMLALTTLHYRFAWWPLNPIGFPAGIVFKVRWTVFPLFLGWLLRLLVWKLGGPGAYQRASAFFVGLMLGWFAGAGLSVLVDWALFCGEGHVIYWH